MDNSRELLEEKIAKRNRIQKMKTGMISLVFIWMLITMIALSFLCYKVYSLQKQINTIISVGGESVAVNSMENSAENSPSEGYINSFGDTAEDNMALPDDIKKVYLTFDDGPSTNTNRILDILDDYNVKATFFVVGHDDEESIAAYKRIVDEGHTIGLHSNTHKYSEVYASLDSFATDVNAIKDIVYNATGVDCKYYRFPGGSSNQVSNIGMDTFIRYINDQNMTYVDWNVQSGDATTQAYTADEIVENVMNDVVKYKTSIVLMHDIDVKTSTVDALPRLIEELQEQGALLLPIDEDTTMIQHVTLQENP